MGKLVGEASPTITRPACIAADEEGYGSIRGGRREACLPLGPPIDRRHNLADARSPPAGEATTGPDGRCALVEPAPERRRYRRTWRDVADEVDAVAAGLAGSGLVAGQRVGICGPNSIEFVITYFAALRAGFVAVPINPGSSPAELTQIVADSGLRVLLTATPDGRGRRASSSR